MKSPKDTNATEKVIVKARYWSFIVYPESAPADWKDTVQKTGLPFCISPLHDKDTNPTGEEKKAHYHVIVCFGGPTTFSNVKKNITDPLGQPHPQYLMSVKGMYRYLTHKDNPEKYQYNETEITHMNGFSITDYSEYTMSDEDRIYETLEQIIESENISEYYHLIIYLKTNGYQEQLSFVRRNTFHIREFLKSARYCRTFDIQETEQQ